MIQEAIHRIRQMERYLDTLQGAMNANPHGFLEDDALREMLSVLTRYYEDGLWLQDYALDELPAKSALVMLGIGLACVGVSLMAEKK